MGINTTCCKKDSSNNESDFRVSNDMSSVINEKIEEFNLKIESLKEVNFAKNTSDAFDFILSGEYYNSLIKGISPYILIGKITKNIFNSDLLKLFQRLIKWGKEYKLNQSNNIVEITKLNLKYATTSLIEDINSLNLKKINQNNGLKKLLIKIITELSLICQYFKFVNENNSNIDYKENFWKVVKIENEIKIYVYKISYSLVKFKKELTEVQPNHSVQNEKENNNKNETIKIYKGVEKYINNIAKKLMGS